MIKTIVTLVTIILLCGYSAKSFSAPAPELVPQVINPYADFIIEQGKKSHIWTNKIEHGWTVKKRKENTIGYKTNGVVQWLDRKSHHILHRSFLPRWYYLNAFAQMSVNAATSHNGSFIASQGYDVSHDKAARKLYWTDTRTGKIVRQLAYAKPPFAFAPNGKYFAATAQNAKTGQNFLQIFSVPDGNVVKTIDLPSTPGVIVWSSDSTHFACTTRLPWTKKRGSPIDISVWNTETFRRIFHKTWKGTVSFTAFDSHGQLRILGPTPDQKELSLHIWSPATNAAQSFTIKLNPQKNGIIGFLDNDGILFRNHYGTGKKNTFQYYALRDGHSLKHLKTSDLQNADVATAIYAFSKNPPPPLNEDDFARLYKFGSVRVSKDKIYASDGSRVFDVLGGGLVDAVRPTPPAPSAYDISPNGKFFTSAGAGAPMGFSKAFWGIWSLGKTSLLNQELLTSHTPGVDSSVYASHSQKWTSQLAFAPNSKKLALSGGLSHPALAVYNLRNRKSIWEHSSASKSTFVRHFDWSRNSRKLAVVMDNEDSKKKESCWKIIDAKTGETLHKYKVKGKVLFLCWSSKNTVLLARTLPDRFARTRYGQPPRNICYLELRNSKTGTLIRTISQTFAAIHTMKASPNGQGVAVGYDNGIMRVWDVERGTLKMEKRAQVADIAWRSNHQVLTAQANDGIRFWNVPQKNYWQLRYLCIPGKKIMPCKNK